ncbi:carbohydrate kinase, partial [Rhizodiscina lignyota]
HIWVVTGPAGCGKTTVGQALANHLGVPYVEGDDHHPPENVKKMNSGIPLTDADRWDWLIALRDHAINMLAQPPPTNPSSSADTTLLPPPAANSGSPPKAVVVTCSALKLKYRDEFRVAAHPIHSQGLNISVHFIYLSISQQESLNRVAARKGHYMKSDMVKSQFESLQSPSRKEKAEDVIEVDVERTPDAVLKDVVTRVEAHLDRE